ncbi:hypothetical protein GCM10022281_00210 [Sphingomonas rosea]|uniref:GTPase n=1 Tax=Sphingomonas rosea TaxID=335605 RepID=A0ABP7TFS4_9SPHN
MSPARLLFVYNADSGLVNALKDAWHKTVSPRTYPCSLCATTYGAVSMRPEWRTFLKRLNIPAVFLHRDEWQRAHPAVAEPLPAIFIQHGNEEPQVLVRATDMPLGQGLDQLMKLLTSRLGAQAGQAV